MRLELTRPQLYHSVGFRPRTEQRVALGAEHDGRLAALIQEAVGQTSTYEEFAEATLDAPAVTYACPQPAHGLPPRRDEHEHALPHAWARTRDRPLCPGDGDG